MVILPVTPEELELCRRDPRKAKIVRGPNSIVCLECGKPLARISAQHLREHRLATEAYKEKWGYNSGSGLACENLTKLRSRMADRQHLAAVGRRNLRPFAKGHRGYRRRREGMLNVNAVHAGRSKLGTRKLVDGRFVPDFVIAEARLRGETLAAIGTRVGLSETAVMWRLRRLRFPSRRGEGARSWCPAFEHGAPMTGQTIRDLLEGSKISALQLTKHIGASPSSLYPHLRRPTKTISFSLGRKIQAVRPLLPRRAPSERGGRPPAFLPADRRTLQAKYHALHRDLVLAREWLNEKGGTAKVADFQGWICAQARSGKIKTLLFWPAFFQWCRVASPGLGFLTTWRPQETAFEFLAHDYGVTPRAVARALWNA